MIPISLLAFSALPFALAVPQPQPFPDPIHVSLARRNPANVEDLPKALAALKGKYNIAPSPNANAKRAGYTTSIPITDEVCWLFLGDFLPDLGSSKMTLATLVKLV